MRHKLLVLLVLVVPAVLMTPLQQKIHRERIQMRYGGARPTIEMREIMSQELWVALLAGFRGVVADFLWIDAHGRWEKREWIQMCRCMDWVTRLQPQSVLFWDLAAWHMAWNIGYAARTDPANHTQAEGLKRERQWQEEARKLLERGIANVPNRYDLYFSMGWLYLRKLSESCREPDCRREMCCRAAEYFGKAAEFPDAPGYTAREYAVALSFCGNPEENYERWKTLWNGGHPRKFADTVAIRGVMQRELKRLENELHLPDEQRVFPRQPASAREAP